MPISDSAILSITRFSIPALATLFNLLKHLPGAIKQQSKVSFHPFAMPPSRNLRKTITRPRTDEEIFEKAAPARQSRQSLTHTKEQTSSSSSSSSEEEQSPLPSSRKVKAKPVVQDVADSSTVSWSDVESEASDYQQDNNVGSDGRRALEPPAHILDMSSLPTKSSHQSHHHGSETTV